MKPSGDSLERSHALVTGGTSGIGQAIALALANGGCRVTCTGVAEGEVTEFGQTIPQELAANLQAAILEVSDEAAIRALVAEQDQIDILINCAGMIMRGGAEFEPDNFTRVLDVNLTGTMRMCTACRPLLARRGGAILNIASMLSFFGSGQAPAYSASKGGVAQLTRSLAIAWAEDGIRVNAIAPGWIATALTQSLYDNEQRRQAILDRTPLGRWGKPEDVTGAALFLCSPAAAFITGVVLPVDGGYSIM